jgi:hypothetical protein
VHLVVLHEMDRSECPRTVPQPRQKPDGGVDEAVFVTISKGVIEVSLRVVVGAGSPTARLQG